MRIPKIVYLNVNVEKAINRERKRKMNKMAKEMTKDLCSLSSLSDVDFKTALNSIETSIMNLTSQDINVAYEDFEEGFKQIKSSKKIKKSSKKRLYNTILDEVAIDSIDEVNMKPYKYSKIKDKILKINDKLGKVLDSKCTKVVMGLAVALFFVALGFVLHKDGQACVQVMGGGADLEAKINSGYNFVKRAGFVIGFIFLCIEIIQKGLKGDTRAMALIFSKYLVLSVILLSYKAIFEYIDSFFNS